MTETPPSRESQVMQMLHAGMSAQATADTLGMSLGAVNAHRYRAERRAGARPRLTHRQRQVVAGVALGLTAAEIARHLGISHRTVVNHRALAGLTLGLDSSVALTHYAIVEHLVDAGDALSVERQIAALERIVGEEPGT